jgi:hypothetical protein
LLRLCCPTFVVSGILFNVKNFSLITPDLGLAGQMASQETLHTRKRLEGSMSSHPGSTAPQKRRNYKSSPSVPSDVGKFRFPPSPPADITDILKQARSTSPLPARQASGTCAVQKRRSRASQLHDLKNQYVSIQQDPNTIKRPNSPTVFAKLYQVLADAAGLGGPNLTGLRGICVVRSVK